MDEASLNEQISGAVLQAYLQAHSATITLALRHPGVIQARAQATAAGISFIAILMVIIQFIVPALLGGTIDWQALIAAILALIGGKK